MNPEIPIVIFILLVISIIVFITTFEPSKCTIEELKLKFNENENTRRISSKILKINRTNALAFYFRIPEKTSYWHLSIFDNEKCLGTVSSTKFLNDETGTMMNVVITHNQISSDIVEKYMLSKHNAKNFYRRLINKTFDVESDSLYICFEQFYVKKSESDNFRCFLFEPSNISFLPVSNAKKGVFDSQVVENKELYKSKFGEVSDIPLTSIKKLKNNESICFKSNTFLSKGKTTIYAVNHFKTRAAIFSYIVVIDVEEKEVIKTFLTGVKTNSIYDKNKMEIRQLTFESYKKVVIFEHIFLYSEEIDEKFLIPMCIKI